MYPQMLLNIIVLGGNTLFFVFQDEIQDSLHSLALNIFFFQCYSLLWNSSDIFFLKISDYRIVVPWPLCEILLNLTGGQKKTVLLARWTLVRQRITGQTFPHVGALGLSNIIAVHKFLFLSHPLPTFENIYHLVHGSHQSPSSSFCCCGLSSHR